MSKWLSMNINKFNLKTNKLQSIIIGYKCPKCGGGVLQETNYCPYCGYNMYEMPNYGTYLGKVIK